MNLPNPPTDNMYKFEAITGLIILVTGILFSFFTMQQIRTQVSQEKARSQILKLNMQYFDKNLAKEENTLTTYEGKTDLTDFEKKDLYDMTNRINDYKNQLKLDSIESIQLDNTISNEKEQLDDLMLILRGSGVLGMFFYIHGWILWYRRLQRYEDIIVKGKADEYSKTQRRRR